MMKRAVHIDLPRAANQAQAAAKQEPQPKLRIRGEKSVRYERIAQAMDFRLSAGFQTSEGFKTLKNGDFG